MVHTFLPLNDSFIQYTQNPFQIVLSIKEFSQIISLDSEYILSILNEKFNVLLNINDLSNIDNDSFNKITSKFFINNNTIYLHDSSAKNYYVSDVYIPRDTFLKITEEIYLNLSLHFLQPFNSFQDSYPTFILNRYKDLDEFFVKLFLYKYLFRRAYFGLEQFHTQFINDSNDNLIIPIDLDRKTKQLLIKLSIEIRNNNDEKIDFIDYIDETFERTYQPYILMNDIIGNDDFLSL